MNQQNLDLQIDRKIGIVGCGHLGQAMAVSLLRQGYLKQNILISHQGNPATYQRDHAKQGDFP